MPATQGHFDLAEFSRAIGHERTDRELTWAELSREVGVSPTTIRRFATADDAEADGVLALIGWLGVAPEHFVAESTVTAVKLPAAGNGMIRVDMPVVATLPTWPHQGRPGGRTTIQRLVKAAQSSGVSVASLTRWSAI